MKTIISAVRGTREFYPQEMSVRRWLYSLIERVSKSFGYEEYDGPFLERIDLYAAKSGEELVKEQAFVFADRGGDLVTLRPELTPSLARMVAQKQNELVYPLRWWSFGPFWRYEKPQKGRTREFFQWNIDMIGVDNVEADSELVAICATFLKDAGILPDQISIVINHRKLMEKKLTEIGISTNLNKVAFNLIDRKDKLSREEWEKLGFEAGLTSQMLEGIEKILTNKDLWRESQELVELFNNLESYGIQGYVKYDPRIIRGLDYYTGIVFEAWDVGGDGRAVLGGGHYDNLVGEVGGNTLPGVGFAMGDVMATLLLEKYGCIPEVLNIEETILVTTFAQDLVPSSIEISKILRESNFRVMTYPGAAKLQKQFKFADRMGVRFVVTVGPDEYENGQVSIKDLKTSTQKIVKKNDLVSTINQMLAIQ